MEIGDEGMEIGEWGGFGDHVLGRYRSRAEK